MTISSQSSFADLDVVLSKAQAEIETRRAQVTSRFAIYRDNPAGFIEDATLGFVWSKQREVCASVVANRRTAVRSCHDVGKSFIASRIVAWWLSCHPPGEAFAISIAPTAHQVKGILWREISAVHQQHGLPGRTNQTEWHIGRALVGLGRSHDDTNPTSIQGYHAPKVLVVIDEACGVAKEIFDAVDTLITNEDCRILAIGNPDDPNTEFGVICKAGSGWNVIGISAFDSPNFTGEEVPDYLRPLLISTVWVEEKRRKWESRNFALETRRGFWTYRSGRLGHTTVPVLAKKKTKLGRIWVYVRDDRPFGGKDPPAAFFEYSASRHGAYPRQHLAGWAGVMQADAFAGFNELYDGARRPGPISEAACGAHGRRKFFDLAKLSKAPIALEAIRRIDELFAIERGINGETADDRRALRQERSKPLIIAFEAFLLEKLALLLAKNDTAKAINYILSRWAESTRFFEDGRVCLSNNAAERALRGVAIGRRNWTFAGSDEGGRRAAPVYTLIESCKLNDVNPQAWFAFVLAKLPDHPAKAIDELLPWNWKAAQDAAAQPTPTTAAA